MLKAELRRVKKDLAEESNIRKTLERELQNMMRQQKLNNSGQKNLDESQDDSGHNQSLHNVSSMNVQA